MNATDLTIQFAKGVAKGVDENRWSHLEPVEQFFVGWPATLTVIAGAARNGDESTHFDKLFRLMAEDLAALATVLHPDAQAEENPRPAHATVALVLAERQRQDEKWGVQNHGASEWLAILVEEIGEAAKELVEWRFGSLASDGPRERCCEELVQASAVALAAAECMVRNGGAS